MKKMMAMILLMVLVMTLVACKNEGQDAENTSESLKENLISSESTEPTEAPTTEATEPSSESTEPSGESTEPSGESTEPSGENTEPSGESTEPSGESTEPSSESTEPSEEPTGPTVEEQEGQRCYHLPDGTKFCSEILDDTGRLIRREAYLNGALYRVWEYEYEDDGDLDWVKFLYDVDSDDWGWQYGGDTMVTEITDQGLKDTFYEDGVISAVVSFTCDWIMEETRYQDGLPAYTCLYDENNSVVMEIHYENGMPFWSRSSTWEEDTEYVDTAFYDEQGRKIQQFHYEEWTERWCSSFTYDENGNLIDEITEYPAENEQVIERKRYVYEADRVRIYEAYTGLNYQAGYDEQGRILWERFGCPYGEYAEYTSDSDYEYDEDGSYIVTWVGATSGLYYSHYDANGNLLDHFGGQDPGDEDDLMAMEEWDTYSYNEYGDMVSYKSYFFGELRTDCRYEYRYDENGHWVELTTYVDGEQMGHYFRTYDDQGRLIREIDDNGVCCDTYTYDEAGNLIEKMQQVGSSGNLYTYTYDKSGRISQEIWSQIQG